MPDSFKPNFMATGIGSLPHLDAAEAVSDVLRLLPEMPYWPQLPALSGAEDMNLQYAPALAPLVAPDLAAREVRAHPGISREEGLAGLYERLMGGPQESFGLTRDVAVGFFGFLREVEARPQGDPPWIKGHVTGPCTLAASVMGADGKAMLYDDETAEAIARGLGAAAAAQCQQMAHLGRPVMVFFDEPFLSGYGSAFTPISREKVVELLANTMEELRNRFPEVVVGIHCCGNTDWAMLVDAGADVLNLDSAGFGEHLLLYPKALRQLFDRGGAVAWGAVPTVDFRGDETGEELWQGLQGLLTRLEEMGFSRQELASQALITPACGMGSQDPDKARRILELTAQVSDLARKQYK